MNSMNSRKRRTGRLVRLVAGCALVVLAAFMLAAGPAESAGALKTIKGIVGTVSGNHIFLDGTSYDLTGIPIRNPSGEELAVEDISPGRKVALSYRRGALSSVLVYDPMVE